MNRIVNVVLAMLFAVFVLVFIYAVSTAAQGRAVQRWTLWATDETGVPTVSLLRFTSLDACYGASLRHGLVTGETATCLPYRLGDFQGARS